MVVVDSSVWIEFFRGRNEPLVSHLSRLLDEDRVLMAVPVRLEILAGAARAEIPRLRRLLSALPLLVPDSTLWSKLEAWVEQGRRMGERFGAFDLLIAGIAAAHGAPLWSQDHDFERMAHLGWVKLHRT